MGIRIDALDAVASAQADHEIPAMRDGATVKLTAEQIATFVIALVTDSAPATLDTLNELAAALGDDPNFATTVTNALATKASLTGAETLTNKTLTAPTISNPSLVLKQSANPAPTAEGAIEWDTDDDALVVGDGSGQKRFRPSGISRATAVVATGVAVDFTGIPSWARRVTVLLDGVSTNGTSTPIVQIGDSGGIEVSNYAGATTTLASTAATTGWSSGAVIRSVWAAASVVSGRITIENIGGNTWVFSLSLAQTDNTVVLVGGGSKTLSDILTQIRVTTAGGSDTFDAGAINVFWE